MHPMALYPECRCKLLQKQSIVLFLSNISHGFVVAGLGYAAGRRASDLFGTRPE